MDGHVPPLERDDVRGILAARRHDPRHVAPRSVRPRRRLRERPPRRSRRTASTRVDRDRRRRHAADGARALASEGLRVVGVPKTIDNDIPGTDMTFGFDTAVSIATEALDRIATTAESHNRIMVVEVMGRTKGWIATYAGIAAGADAILVPEVEPDLDAVAATIRARHRHGRTYSIVVVAEGCAAPRGERRSAPAIDAFGFERLGGVGYLVRRRARAADRVRDARHRARAPPARRHADGVRPRARDALRRRRRRPRGGRAVRRDGGAARRPRSIGVPLAEACAEVRGVDPALLDVARTFFG